MHPDLFTIPGIGLTIPSFGAMVLLGFLAATFTAFHRARKLRADPDIILNLGFLILIFSTIGARAFYVIHYWDQYASNPRDILNLRGGGFEFYGGFLGAFAACYLYIWLKGLSRRLYADILAPSLLLAMGIGRIGCLLFGCCWGGPCPADLPWAVRFPYSSPVQLQSWEHRETTLPARLILVDSVGRGSPIPRKLLALSLDDLKKATERAEEAVARARASGRPDRVVAAETRRDALMDALRPLLFHFAAFNTSPSELADLVREPRFRSHPVHPAQLYSAVGPILLSFLTTAWLHRRKRHGTVFVLGFMLYAVERFIEEAIRVDNPQDTFGLTVSQGISIGVFVGLGIWGLILLKMPLRSSRKAVASRKEAPPAAAVLSQPP